MYEGQRSSNDVTSIHTYILTYISVSEYTISRHIMLDITFFFSRSNYIIDIFSCLISFAFFPFIFQNLPLFPAFVQESNHISFMVVLYVHMCHPSGMLLLMVKHSLVLPLYFRSGWFV